MMVKVSVIVPVYNVEKYLAECLDCLVNQTLNDIEILCINDGSTDNSPEILESFAKKDSRIKVIHKDNQGAGATRNVGLDNAIGEYIYFLDADDFIELDTLEETYNSSAENDLDVLIFQLINYDDEKDEYYNSGYYDMPKLAEFIEGDVVFNYKDIGDLIFNVAVSPVNKLYKRELINKFNVRFPEGMIFEDNIFFWNVFLNAKRILFVKKHYYIRRVHLSSVMGSASIKFIDTIKIHNMVIEIFKEHKPSLPYLNNHPELFEKLEEVVPYSTLIDLIAYSDVVTAEEWNKMLPDENGDVELVVDQLFFDELEDRFAQDIGKRFMETFDGDDYEN